MCDFFCLAPYLEDSSMLLYGKLVLHLFSSLIFYFSAILTVFKANSTTPQMKTHHQLYRFSTTFKINPWLASTISYQSFFKILHYSTNRILNWVSHNLQLPPNFHFHSASLGLRMEKLISMVLSWLGF